MKPLFGLVATLLIIVSTPARAASDITPLAPPQEIPTSNLSLGVNYVFPILDYQYLVTRHTAVGLTTMFFNYPASPGQMVTGGGAFVTVNYYGFGPFEGPWVQFAGGVQSLVISQGVLSEYTLRPAVIFQVGWRWQLTTGANFGIGVGAQYLVNFKPKTFTTNFSGLVPAFTLEIGFPL